MSSYSDLATQIINKGGKGGRFSGLNQFLDVKQAYADAQRQFQFQRALKKQESQSDAAKGIAQAGLLSGVTPDVGTAMSQYNQMTGANGIASGLATQSSTDNTQPVEGKLYGKVGIKQQDTLEKQYTDRLDKVLSNRSGGLGVQDSKVNQAIDLRTMMDQYYNPNIDEYNIPSSQYEELAIGLAKLLAPTGVAAVSTIDNIKQRTAKGDFNGAVGYITGTTPSGSSKEVFKNLADSINRQGLKSEQLRDKYLQNVRQQFPTRLDKNVVSRLEKTSFPNSYSDEFQKSPAYQAEQVGNALKGGGTAKITTTATSNGVTSSGNTFKRIQ